MAELTTIARPYAKAAFMFAREANALEQWEKTLAVAAVVAGEAAMADFLAKPELSSSQKVEIFSDTCAEVLKAPLDEHGKNLISLLAQNDRLSVLPLVYQLFHELVAEAQSFVDARIFSAHELEAGEVERLVESLRKRLGREIRATSVIDESLIGGVIIRAGDTVIDGSVRGRLARLADQMKS